MGMVPLNQRMRHSEKSKTRSRGRQSEGSQLEAHSRHPQAGASGMNSRGKQLDAKGSKVNAVTTSPIRNNFYRGVILGTLPTDLTKKLCF